MPELPEVEALRGFLAERLTGLRVARVLPVAISVLKTYDPPLTALEGHTVTGADRHGKFLALRTDSGPRFITHLARAGRLRWQDRLSACGASWPAPRHGPANRGRPPREAAPWNLRTTG